MEFKGKFFQNESGDMEVKKFNNGLLTIKTTGEFVVDVKTKEELIPFFFDSKETKVEVTEEIGEEPDREEDGDIIEESDDPEMIDDDIEEAEYIDEQQDDLKGRKLEVIKKPRGRPKK